jgi:PAS domain S-box-containing protein
MSQLQPVRNRSLDLQKETEEARPFLMAVARCNDYAIIGETLDGTITLWNRGAERLFGYTPWEVIGKPITLLIPPDVSMEEAGILECIRTGTPVEHYETRRVRKDGSIIDVALNASPVKNEKGEIIGASQIICNITEKKRMEAEAQAAGRMKDEFLAVLSHELRTPLHVILAWADILKSGRHDDLVRGAAETIHRNAKTLKRLIDDLLDLSRIVTGKLAIKSHRVDLGAVAKAAIASAGPAAAAKAITVELSVAESGQCVTGDWDRLLQVIWHLLANAIKFTPQNGKVQVFIRNAGNDVELIVSDTGEGISSDFLPRIFEPFSQEDLSSTRKHGGIGVGLSVVQHLVEAHGGTICAGSDGRGQGTTFHVRLPMFKKGFMKTGLDVIRGGLYTTECCLQEVGLEQRQRFPRCPKCLGLTVWIPVRFTPAIKKQKAA